MPRPNRPGYFAPRKCWRFEFQGKQRYICKGIPPDERPQREGIPRRVWDEMDRIIRDAESLVTSGLDPSLYWLVQLFLTWTKGQVAAGVIPQTEYDSRNYRLAILLEVIPNQQIPVRLITFEVADDLFARLRSYVSPSTGQPISGHYLHSIGKTFRLMLRWAARPMAGRTPSQVIRADPLPLYKYPRQPGAVRGYVEGVIVRRFLRWAWARARWVDVKREVDPKTNKLELKPAGKSAANLKRRFNRIFVLMLRFERLTGCRPGEACGLVWSEIHPPIPVAVEGKPTPKWEPTEIQVGQHRNKTRKMTDRERVIFLTEPVSRLLRTIERLPGRHPEYVFTHMRGTRAVDRGFCDPVAGEPWPDGSAASKPLTQWRKAAILAGVEGIEAIGPKKLIAYANRHGFASEGSSLGFTDEQIAEQMGNTPEVMRKVYAHQVKNVAAETAKNMAERRREIGRKNRPVKQTD